MKVKSAAGEFFFELFSGHSTTPPPPSYLQPWFSESKGGQARESDANSIWNPYAFERFADVAERL